jgi:hypothetical protein
MPVDHQKPRRRRHDQIVIADLEVASITAD